MRDAFLRGLTALAEADGRTVLLTGDLGYKIFDDFVRRFSGRFINAGVAEANMIGAAAGLALGGMRPFAYSIVPFATLRCLEQIRNDVCYHNLPVTVVGVGGGYSYGHNGATHHALEDIAVMRALPNMAVICPGSPAEAEAAVRALARHAGPAYLRLGRAGEPEVYSELPAFRVGEAIPVRVGTDCTLVSTGAILRVAIAAAELLAGQGISCRVLSMHTVKPLDQAALAACCRETRAVFTLEEHSRIGGLGSAVAEWMAACGARVPLHCFGAGDCFAATSGSQAYFRERHGLTAEQIARSIAARLQL